MLHLPWDSNFQYYSKSLFNYKFYSFISYMLSKIHQMLYNLISVTFCFGDMSILSKTYHMEQIKSFWKNGRVILWKWNPILYFPQEFCFNKIQYILGMNPLCKCKANKSPTLHTLHLSCRNESKVARSLGWVEVAGSSGDRGAFTFHGGNFLNSQIVKAKGRRGLQGNDSKLTFQKFILFGQGTMHSHNC
jgi:hypothetical protein